MENSGIGDSLKQFAQSANDGYRGAVGTMTEHAKSFLGIGSKNSSEEFKKNLNLITQDAVAIGMAAGLGVKAPELMSASLKSEFTQARDQVNSITTLASGLFNKGVSGVLRQLKDIAIEETKRYLQDQSALHETINVKLGLAGKLSQDLRAEITASTPALERMGIEFGEVADSITTILSETGKFTMMSRESISELGKTGMAYLGSMSALAGMIPKFQTIGYGMRDAVKHIDNAGKSSLNVGLNSRKVTSDISANLSRLNEFGFSKGVEGLTQMVKKSIEFRTNIDSVFRIAEKTMDVTNAINLSAELSAIGGNVGNFLDPFKMAYDAVNNVEGIQDSLLEMTKNLTTYNQETGRFEVTGVNLRIASEYAKTLGMNTGEFVQSAIAGAERQQVINDLLARGLDLTKEQSDFVSNIAQMRDGEMVIELKNDKMRQLFGGLDFVKLENLTEKEIAELQKYQDEFKKMSSEDVVRDQANDIKNIHRDLSFIAASMRIANGRGVVDAAKLVGYNLPGRKANETLSQASKRITDGIAKVGVSGVEGMWNYIGESRVAKMAKKSIEDEQKGLKEPYSTTDMKNDMKSFIDSATNAMKEMGQNISNAINGSNKGEQKVNIKSDVNISSVNPNGHLNVEQAYR